MTEHATIDVLASISEHSDFYASICFTYGADLAFFEEAVLHPLWQNGCRHNLVFMDALRYADTIGPLRGSVTWVGRRYLLIPIDLGMLQSFHPKLILLLGSQRGRLMVGSGNVTFTGLGHNHEVFTCLDWTPDTPDAQQVFAGAWNLINEVCRRWSYSSEVGRILHKIVHVADWLVTEGEPTEDVRLLHSVEDPLVDQCGQAMDPEAVDRITILSPFLDRQALALSGLNARFNPQVLRLVLQEGQVVGNIDSLKKLIESGVPLEVYRFADHERYSHAKIYIFETSNSSFVLSGSPNCTRSAWLSSADDGNLEVALLHRSDSRGHSLPLIDDRFLYQTVTSLDEVLLREDRLPEVESRDPVVRLLDLSYEGGMLLVALRLLRLPKEVDRFQLRLSTKPEHFILLETLETGDCTVEIALPSDTQAALGRPCSASIWGLTSDGRLSDLRCNELWITNVDVLHQETISALPADARTGTYLAEMALGSDEEWRDLYNSLVRLVELEVAGLKQRGGTYTASPRKDQRPQEGTRARETDIRIVTEEDISREHEDVATVLFQESQLHTWIGHVRRGLPGAEPRRLRADDDPSSGPEDAPMEPARPIQRQAPPEQVGRSFKNLVRKYIRSLGNQEYMHTASTHHIVAYYSIFQRIVGLLLQHNVISAETLLEFSAQINQGFFGGPEEAPPCLCSRLSRHIRHVWREEWLEQEVPVYALVTALLPESPSFALSGTSVGDNAEAAMREQTLRIVCAVISVVGLEWIGSHVSELAQVSDEVFAQDADAFSLQAANYIDTHLSDLEDILHRWTLTTSVDLANVDDSHRKDRLRRARMAYGFARYQVLTRLPGGDSAGAAAQESLRGDLIRWMRAIDDVQSSREWAATLVRVLDAEGKSGEVARVVYQEGHKLFYEGFHEESASRFRQSLQMAEGIGDTSLVKKCQRYLSHTEFFLKHNPGRQT